MKDAFRKAACAIGMVCAATVAATAQAVPLSYEVMATTGLVTGRVTVPEVMLPPPGPQRDALQGRYPTREVEYKRYLLLLRNEAGDYAQCAGLTLSTAFTYYNQQINALGLDLIVNDRDLLQILRRNTNSVHLPAYLGGCTAIAPDEAAQLTANTLGIKMAFAVEAQIDMPLYGRETQEETITKRDLDAQGRGVSLRWATGRCNAAGWNDRLSHAQPGDVVTVRALCPR